MTEPTTLIGAAAAKYGPVGVGLAIGTAAKYGIALKEGRRPTFRELLADLLLQGVLALIAVMISEQLSLSGNSQAFVAALVALNSHRLVKLARDVFFRKVEAELAGGGDSTP